MKNSDINDNPNEFTIKNDEEFTIKLESKPTAGYTWQPVFDEGIVKLISKDFIPMTKQMGASGIERFIFKAIKSGRTTVKMIYKRDWEKESRKEKEFSVNIV